jgi:hypothetical protein
VQLLSFARDRPNSEQSGFVSGLADPKVPVCLKEIAQLCPPCQGSLVIVARFQTESQHRFTAGPFGMAGAQNAPLLLQCADEHASLATLFERDGH